MIMDYRDRSKDYSDRNRNDLTTRERERATYSDRDRNPDYAENRETTSYKDRDENRRLHFLTDLDDYKVASGDPDVRGWEVVDVNNKPVGKVDNLLVDIRREKVRYLDVDLNQEIINENHDPLENNNATGVHEYIKDGGDVHMIVPIGLARVDGSNKKVISDEINRNILEKGHVHRKGEIIRPEYERNVIDCIRANDPNCTTVPTTGTGDREIYNMREAGNREMHRPESQHDPRLSRTSETGRTTDRASGFGKESPEANRDLRDIENQNTYREARDRTPNTRGRGLEDERLDRHTRDAQVRGPINDDFYDQSYFDERRFYGRQ
jgi:hypothetical protein